MQVALRCRLGVTLAGPGSGHSTAVVCPQHAVSCVCVQVHIEGLYEEELPQRAAAADMLCQLFRNSSNLQVGGAAAAHNNARWWLWVSWNAHMHACMHETFAGRVGRWWVIDHLS